MQWPVVLNLLQHHFFLWLKEKFGAVHLNFNHHPSRCPASPPIGASLEAARFETAFSKKERTC